MRKNIITNVICSVVLALLLGLQPAIAFQQADATPAPAPESAFSIRPVGEGHDAFFDNVEVSPGETVSLEIRVLNFGSGAVDLRVYKANVTNPPNGGVAAGQEDDDQLEVTSWIVFPAEDVALEPGEALIMPFQIAVPEDALPGQYVAAFVAGEIDPTLFAGSETIDYRMRFAMPISILVPGEMNHSFELGDPVLEGSLLSVPITNTGNYRIRPEGPLVLKNAAGEPVVQADIVMQSVYNGNSTTFYVSLQSPLPKGEYTLSVSLEDTDSGAKAELTDVPVEISQADVAVPMVVVSSVIEPNAPEIAFANVDVSIANNGQQIQATTVTLGVFLDGELFDEFPLATNQVMLAGENDFQTRYIPADMWEPGTYTFRISVLAVDPSGGQQVELLNEPLDAKIVVP